MTTVTVTRGARSVTMDVYEQAGSLHVARDAGKPASSLYRVGGAEPIFSDHRAPIEAYTVVGQLVGDGAYEDARVLAEDIVLPYSGGTEATLDLSDVSGLGSVNVGFVGNRAVAFGYPPNQGEWVSIQLTAVKVTNTLGVEGIPTGATGTPGSGTGPVTISRGATNVELVKDLDVERKVGRPASEPRHTAGDDPYLVDKPRAYHDVFELSGVWTVDAAAKQDTLIEQIVKPPLGFGTLTLNFNGLYGLGSYEVAPIAANAARVSWSAGEAGMVRVEGLQLMRVRTVS